MVSTARSAYAKRLGNNTPPHISTISARQMQQSVAVKGEEENVCCVLRARKAGKKCETLGGSQNRALARLQSKNLHERNEIEDNKYAISTRYVL